jgi:hypothetical protein
MTDLPAGKRMHVRTPLLAMISPDVPKAGPVTNPGIHVALSCFAAAHMPCQHGLWGATARPINTAVRRRRILGDVRNEYDRAA